MPGHAENPHVFRLGHPPQAAARLDAVEAGQYHVEDDQRRTERADLDERLVAVGRRLDRERPVNQEVVKHLDDERLVVDEQDSGARLGRGGIRRPALREQEALELGEVDAAVAPGCEVRAELARPDPAPERGDRDPAVSRRLPGREMLPTPGRRRFHFLHI
jgi:hypothetical protein